MEGERSDRYGRLDAPWSWGARAGDGGRLPGERPEPPAGGVRRCSGDHRVLMAAAVAGLAAEDPVDISDPWSFRVSYPTFLDDLRSLGALHAVVG